MTFEQRRALVLTAFGIVAAGLTAVAFIHREPVGRTIVWLFSDSMGALVLMSILSGLWALKRQGKNRYVPNRGQPPQQRVGFPTPPGENLIKALLAFVIIGGVMVWIISHS